MVRPLFLGGGGAGGLTLHVLDCHPSRPWQPCASYEENVSVRRVCTRPFIIDENIEDLTVILRIWQVRKGPGEEIEGLGLRWRKGTSGEKRRVSIHKELLS